MIILKIIFFLILAYDLFLVTPFGMLWVALLIENNKVVYPAIILAVTAPIAVSLIGILGYQ